MEFPNKSLIPCTTRNSNPLVLRHMISYSEGPALEEETMNNGVFMPIGNVCTYSKLEHARGLKPLRLFKKNLSQIPEIL